MGRLLVLGNAGLDIGLALPRLPLPGETLVGASRGSQPGGKGLNQAVVASRAGLLPVAFLAPLGDDAEGARVAAVLGGEDFVALDLPRPGPATDCSVLMVVPDGENSIVTAGRCAAALPVAAARDAVSALLPGAWLLMQGNLSPDATEAACVAARGAAVPAVLNTAPLAFDMGPLLPFCAVVVANAGEAQALTGRTGTAAAAALRAAGAAVAIVTLGSSGCAVAAADGNVRLLPAPAVEAVDSTGAGDTFCGVLAACLASGHTLEPAVSAAQRAASRTVERPGCFAALPSRAELAAILGTAAER